MKRIPTAEKPSLICSAFRKIEYAGFVKKPTPLPRLGKSIAALIRRKQAVATQDTKSGGANNIRDGERNTLIYNESNNPEITTDTSKKSAKKEE